MSDDDESLPVPLLKCVALLVVVLPVLLVFAVLLAVEFVVEGFLTWVRE